MKIGLFFGSFNPIHVGHLIVASVIHAQTDLQQVWFVVSPQNPFKQTKNLLNEYDRLRMVEMAVEDNYDLRACNVEFSMPKPSYTADTLAYLGERYPQHQFHLILGGDSLTHFHRWKNHRVIIDNHQLYTYPRPGSNEKKVKGEIAHHPNVRTVEAPLLNISATFIRNLIQQEHSIQYLVADPVAEYIRNRKLYL